MSEFVGPNAGSEKPGSNPLLRDILLETTFKPGRAISAGVDRIDLGVFSEEARALANECFLEPDNSNFGKLIYVTGSKKVLVPKVTFGAVNRRPLGMMGTVSAVPKELAEKEALDERYLAMVIHTSSNHDTTFSATGVALLIEPDSLAFGTSCLFIAGKTQNMLIFRGQNTPQLFKEDIEKKAKLWMWSLSERVGQFVKPGMSEEEAYAVLYAAQNALLKQVCQKYDLPFFVGPSDSNEVVKQSL